MGAGSNTFSGAYSVGAKGYILDSQYVEISPADSFSMTDGTFGLDSSAAVTQSVTKWMNDTAGKGEEYMVLGGNSVTSKTGSMSVTLKKPDTYTETLTFAYGLRNLQAGRRTDR